MSEDLMHAKTRARVQCSLCVNCVFRVGFRSWQLCVRQAVYIKRKIRSCPYHISTPCLSENDENPFHAWKGGGCGLQTPLATGSLAETGLEKAVKRRGEPCRQRV